MTVTTLTFGKYKGKTYEEVLNQNPNYLAWANREVTGFNLSLDQQVEVAKAVDAEAEKLYARQEAWAYGFPRGGAWWKDDESDMDYDHDYDGDWGEPPF